MSDLGTAYLKIVPEMKGARRAIASDLKGVEAEGDKTGKGLGGRIASGMGGILKKSAVGVGAAAGGAVAVGLTKGLGRLHGIEQAEAKLTGLGHSAQGVGSIMEDALESVRGTAFGLEDAATIAASAVAAGIKPGEDLQRTLKLTGDAATIAGAELGEMGSIINKVATSDMMQMDVANQLMDAGIPILQLVAAEMGVTADEARKMASEGKVSFEIFQNALESGMGGAALEAGNTVQGAFANMGAAAGRLGATIAGPFFRQAASGFGGVTDLLDDMNDRVGPVMQNFEDWLTSPAAAEWGNRIQGAATAVAGFGQELVGATVGSGQFMRMLETGWEAASRLAPAVVQIGTAAATATAALGVSTWQVFISALDSAGSILNATLVPALELVGDFAESNTGAVTALAAGWMAFKTIPAVINGVSTAALGLKTATLGAHESAVSWFNEARRGDTTIRRMENAFAGAETATQGFGRAVKVGAMPAMKGLGSAAQGLLGVFGGPWAWAIAGGTALLTGMVNASNRAKDAQAQLEGQSAALESAQRGLRDAIAGTTGALGEQGLAAAAKVAEAEMMALAAVGDQVDGLMVKTHSLSESVSTHRDERREERKEVLAAGDAYNQIKDTAEGMNYTMDDVHRIVAEGGDEFDNLKRAVLESEEGWLTTEGSAQRAADELDRARQVVEESIEAAQNMSPAFRDASDGLEVLGDASSSANDKLTAIEQTMVALGLAPKDVERAARDAAESIDDLAGSISGMADQAEGVGESMFDMAGQLDYSNGNSRELADTLDGMRGTLQNVAVNGGDVTGTFMDMQGNLAGLQSEFGLSDEKMQGLVRQFGLIPEAISTLVNLDGVEQANIDLIAVAAGLQDIPEGQDVHIGVIDEEARDKLEEFGYTVQEIKDSEGNVIDMTVTAQTEEANEEILAFSMLAAELKNFEIDPTVALNTEQVDIQTEHVQGLLDGLDVQTPTPTAGIAIENLLSGNGVALRELAILAAQSPTPTADLNKILMDAGVDQATIDLLGLDTAAVTSKSDLDKSEFDDKNSDVNSDLDELDDRTVKPYVDAQTGEARDRLSEVKSDIDNLPREKTVRVRVRYETTGTRPPTGGQTGGQYRGATSGFARYADGGRHGGYRLPSSGPGTEIVDGFTALDQFGNAIARLDKDEWVINGRSSERYDKELAQINAGTFPKLPGYNTGGRVDEPAAAASSGRSREGLDRALAEGQSSMDAGGTYLYGGNTRTQNDCSGFVSRVAWAAKGVDPDAVGRHGNTNSMMAGQWEGFTRGRNGPFIVGVNSAHMAATLDGIPVESGGNVGGPSVGVGQGADNPQFTQHWSLDHDAFSPPYSDYDPADDAVTVRGDSGGAPGEYSSTSTGRAPDREQEPQKWSEWVGEQIGEGAKQWIKGTTSAYAADTLGVFGLADEMPSYVQAGFQAQAAVDERDRLAQEEAEREAAASSDTGGYVSATAPAAAQNTGDIGHTYDPSRGAEQWRPLIEQALARTGNPSADVGRTEEQVDIESGGDPDAVNNWDSNAQRGDPSKGLLQVIGQTFAAYRDPELPNDQFHPLANLAAGMNYAKSTYGSLDSVWPTAAGYNSGGWVGGKRKDRHREDTEAAWLTPGEFVVTKDGAAGNESLLEAMNAGELARDVTKASTHAAITASTGAAATGLSAAGMMVPALAPFATAGGALLNTAGATIADVGSSLMSEVVGQVADAGVRMATAGEQTLRANAPEFVPAPAPSSQGSTSSSSSTRVEAHGGDSREVHIHYHVSSIEEAMRRGEAEMAQYSRALV